MHTGGQRLYQIHNFSQKFLVLAEKHALHVDAVLGAASIRWVHLWSERAITFSPGIQYLSVNLHSLSHKGKIHQKAHTVASLLHVCLAETLYGSGVQSVFGVTVILPAPTVSMHIAYCCSVFLYSSLRFSSLRQPSELHAVADECTNEIMR